MLTTKRQLFMQGLFDSLPLVAGGVPFGIIFGTLAFNAGLTIWQIIGMSSLVFAGSAQFVALGMLAAGSSIGLIIGTTIIINLRHLIYAVSFLPHVKHLPQRWRVAMGFLLVDEVFAATFPRYLNQQHSANNHWHYIGVGVSFFICWNIATIIGIFFGANIHGITQWGLEFAMAATFIGIVMPYLITKPMVAAVLTSGILAIITYNLPNKLGLIIATVVGILVGYVLDNNAMMVKKA